MAGLATELAHGVEAAGSEDPRGALGQDRRWIDIDRHDLVADTLGLADLMSVREQFLALPGRSGVHDHHVRRRKLRKLLRRCRGIAQFEVFDHDFGALANVPLLFGMQRLKDVGPFAPPHPCGKGSGQRRRTRRGEGAARFTFPMG